MLSGIAPLFIFLHQPLELAPASANPLTSITSELCFKLLTLEPQCLTFSLIGNVTSRRDAEAFSLIVFVLGSVFCFWYRFHLSAPQCPSGPRLDSPP